MDFGELASEEKGSLIAVFWPNNGNAAEADFRDLMLQIDSRDFVACSHITPVRDLRLIRGRAPNWPQAAN
jgi:hypothetical protein